MILLGLGSNIGDREKNIINALHLLELNFSIKIISISSLYETEPVGLKEQPPFLNIVCKIKTELQPDELLKSCLSVEKDLGRVRMVHWGPRIIDIDILFYNDEIINSEILTIPHPRITERKFVLIPLLEICRDEKIFKGCTASDWLKEVEDDSQVVLYKKVNWSDYGDQT